MRALGDYHCKDVHTWEGGKCGFHEKSVCSCGECDDDEPPECEGKSYTTKNVIKCPFHHLAYRTECLPRANDAKAVIHPELGRGNSNQCEGHFSVLPHFRAKDQSLCRYLQKNYELHALCLENNWVCENYDCMLNYVISWRVLYHVTYPHKFMDVTVFVVAWQLIQTAGYPLRFVYFKLYFTLLGLGLDKSLKTAGLFWL